MLFNSISYKLINSILKSQLLLFILHCYFLYNEEVLRDIQDDSSYEDDPGIIMYDSKKDPEYIAEN